MKKTPPIQSTLLRFLLALILITAEVAAQDCIGCATVEDLDPSLHPTPFKPWEDLLYIVGVVGDSNLDITDIDYTSHGAYTLITNNTIIRKYTSTPYNQARGAAINSGLTIKCTEYNASDKWLVQWGDNDFSIEGYPLLETELNAVKTQNKIIKFVSIADGSDAFVIILDDGTLVHNGLNAAVLTAISNNASALKSMSFNAKGDVAIVKSDGALVLLTPSFDVNDNNFIAKIQSDFYQLDPSAEADFLHLGNDDHLLFYGRNTTGPVFFAKGPTEQVKDIKITENGDRKAEITSFMSESYRYQLQDRSDLTVGSWRNIGPEVIGDNSYKLFSSTIESDRNFYRFVIRY